MKLIYLLLILSSFCFAKELRVLEIDTGIGSEDQNGHGSHIAGIITRDVCPEVKLISCKYYENNNSYSDNFKNEIICFRKAETIKPFIINFSSGGNIWSKEEFDIIKKLSDQGIIIVTAAGNNNQDLSLPQNNYYPAKYKIKNLIPVGNLTENGYKNPTSNYGLENMVWEMGTNILSNYLNGSYVLMTGTSQATAFRTNRILKEKCSELK